VGTYSEQLSLRAGVCVSFTPVVWPGVKRIGQSLACATPLLARDGKGWWALSNLWCLGELDLAHTCWCNFAVHVVRRKSGIPFLQHKNWQGSALQSGTQRHKAIAMADHALAEWLDAREAEV